MAWCVKYGNGRDPRRHVGRPLMHATLHCDALWCRCHRTSAEFIRLIACGMAMWRPWLVAWLYPMVHPSYPDCGLAPTWSSFVEGLVPNSVHSITVCPCCPCGPYTNRSQTQRSQSRCGTLSTTLRFNIYIYIYQYTQMRHWPTRRPHERLRDNGPRFRPTVYITWVGHS